MLLRKEITARELLRKSDTKSQIRSGIISVKYEKVIGDEAYFSTTRRYSGGKSHLIILRCDKFKTGMSLSDMQAILRTTDVTVACSCPAFLYQGYKYITYNMGAGIDPENRRPRIKNKNEDGCLCKHLIAVLKKFS